MEYTQYILPNGIRCIHKQVKSAVVHCAITINVGSRDELPSEHGLAHLIEHSIFKGTAKRKAYQVNCRLENLGGELNAYTTKEETVVHTTTLRGDFSKAADLLSDIVFCSVFPEKEVMKEKDIIIDEINSYKDNPAENIFDDFEDLIFSGSPLGHNILGDRKSLKKLSSTDIHNFMSRTYNTDQIVFSAIGNISERRFIEICNRYFSQIAASPRTFGRKAESTYTPFNKIVNKNSYQAHCIMGGKAYDLTQNKRVILSLLTNILGGPSANSLLNISLRERRGLSYNIEASYTPFSDAGIWTIYFGTDKDKVDKCISLINKQIDDIKNTGLTPRALSMWKKQFIGQLTIASESNEGYMLSAARSYMIYNSVDSMETIRKKIESITLEEIKDVACEIFNDQCSSLIYK